MDLSRYAPIPWEASLHCNDVSQWLGAYLGRSLLSLSVMLINTAFSHSNEECSPCFLVIIHQTQARDGINGLMQEKRNSIANALEYVFLAPSHQYKENHLWVTPPPPPLIISSFDEINMTMPYFFIFRRGTVKQSYDYKFGILENYHCCRVGNFTALVWCRVSKLEDKFCSALESTWGMFYGCEWAFVVFF